MRILFKYFFWLLSLFFIVIYYFIGTSLGNLNLKYLVEDYYNKKMNNKLEVLSLDIDQYPKVVAEVRVNDTALLSLNGVFDKDEMELDYHLRGQTFEWDQYRIPEPVDVTGKMQGKFSELFISGKGEIFDGFIDYEFIRKSNRLENMKVVLSGVQSKPLLKFLRYKNLLEGEIDVSMDFEYFTAYKRNGSAKVSMPKGTIPIISEEVVLDLEAEILIKDLLHEFFADIKSDLGKLRVANGRYNRAANITTADYGLHISELGYFEDFLQHKYKGSLNTAGSVAYDNGDLVLNGDTITYGGLLLYNYQNDHIDIDFKGVSLEKFLRQLSFPPLLSSKIYGSASYDIKDEVILINTELKETRFRRTKMTDTIHEMTGIDILKNTYNDSIFTAGYEDNILTSFLKIDNGVSHLYLRDTKMNSKTNEVTANFEVKIDGQEFAGEVYGTLEDPKVNLDMSKLIQYQINKKINNFFGTGKALNRKNTEEKFNEIHDDLNREIQNFEIGQVERKARSFLDGFFD